MNILPPIRRLSLLALLSVTGLLAACGATSTGSPSHVSAGLGQGGNSMNYASADKSTGSGGPAS